MIKRTGALILALLVLSACEKRPPDYSILFGGDVFLARNGVPIFSDWSENNDPWGELTISDAPIIPKFGYQKFFVANLESPIDMLDYSVIGMGDMSLCADSSQLSILERAGLTLVNTANNHQNDCEINGEKITQQALEDVNIRFAGSDMKPAYLQTTRGLIAFIAVDDVSTTIDLGVLVDEIKLAKEKSQVVIISTHWGNEYQAGPDVRQQELAQALTDAGADIIWGHHPHVLQRMEWLKSTIDDHEALVIYSMGNLLTDQYMSSDVQQSALINVEFSDGNITKILVTPIIMDVRYKQLKISTDDKINLAVYERLGLESLSKRNIKIETPENSKSPRY